MDDKETAFRDWFSRRGGYISPKVSLFGDSGIPGDRGVRAVSDIKEGEQLLLVPVQSTLHVPKDATDAAAKSADPPAALAYLTENHPGLSAFLKTSLLLLGEMALGDKSSYWPYVHNLPDRSDCLLYWDKDEKVKLTGTSIEDRGGSSAEEVFEAQVKPVLAGCPALFPPPYDGYEHFRRAVDLTQTRAFHMVKENWVTGAAEESADDLYLIPGIDMLNHSTDPKARNTQLFRFSSGTEVELEGGKTLSPDGIFAMKAERAIPAGQVVLHTYGDLSDGQLLQTYGFVEDMGEEGHNPHNYALMPFTALVEACRSTAEGVGGELGDGLLAAKVDFLARCHVLQAAAPTSTEFVISRSSPAPEELLTAAQVLLLMEEEFEQLKLEHEGPKSTTTSSKEAAAAADPAKTSNGSGSVKQRKKGTGTAAAAGGGGKPPAAAAAGGGAAAGAGSSSSSGGKQQQQQRLCLGRELLSGDFGELVASAILQAVGLCLKRYPQSVKDDMKALRGATKGSRTWAATKVALGEKDLLQLLKKEALQIMMQAAAGEDDDDEDEDECEDEDEFEDEDEDDSEDDEDDDDEGEEEEEMVAAAKQKRSRHGLGYDHEKQQQQQEEQEQEEQGRASKKSRKGAEGKGAERKQQGTAAAAAGGGGAAGGQEKKSGSRRGKVGAEPEVQHEKHKKQGKRDDRPHYGQMTGPKEEEVWQSDDSDKVGYSSDEDEGDAAPPPAAAPAAGGGKGRTKRKRRPIGDPSEPHRYEVAAGGAVREAHGHMLGPEEAELLDSDDSDKVGYA